MYEFPYSAIFEEAPAPVPCRSRLISNAIELFGAAGRSSFQPFEQLQLLSDFRRLWLLIEDDLDHAFEERPGFPAAAQSVLQEIERRRFKPHARSAARPEPLSDCA